jgi:homoserine trans-succinylase
MLRMSYYDTAEKLAESSNLQVMNMVAICWCWQYAVPFGYSLCNMLQSVVFGHFVYNSNIYWSLCIRI